MSIVTKNRQIAECDLESEINTTTMVEKLIYTKENGGKWWTVVGGVAVQVQTGTTQPVRSMCPDINPVGIIYSYSGTSAPTGYLMADGSAVSRTTYADLFAITSTTYGAGNGSTTFNVPDLRQRFVLTKAASGTGSTLGATGGTIDHVHTVDPPNTTTGAPSGTVLATALGGGAASTTHTHDVNIAQFDSGANNPPYLVLNAIIKY